MVRARTSSPNGVPERVVAAPAPEPAVVQSPNSTIPERCFKAFVARYRISSEFLDLAASTRAEYERHMRYVEPAIGLASIAAFTADHMDRIMSKYPENPALRQAIQRTVSVLLSYAARTLKWIPSNPLLRTDKPRKRREEGQKPFTEPEIARYRETHLYGTRERLTFEIGLSTAFRREDIARVKDEDILAGLIPLLTNKAAFSSSLRSRDTSGRVSRIPRGPPGDGAVPLCVIKRRTVTPSLEATIRSDRCSNPNWSGVPVGADRDPGASHNTYIL